MLAVYGVYAILCRFLAHGCYKGDLAVGLRLQRKARETDPAALAEGLRRARFLTEGQRGKMLPPVILLDGCPPASSETIEELKRECEVYYKIT
jgi:hypothetical protein